VQDLVVCIHREWPLSMILIFDFGIVPTIVLQMYLQLLLGQRPKLNYTLHSRWLLFFKVMIISL
jgi:hypothetical protein